MLVLYLMSNLEDTEYRYKLLLVVFYFFVSLVLEIEPGTLWMLMNVVLNHMLV